MHTVEWSHQALNQLTDLWTSSTPVARAQITAAIQLLDRLLAQDPLQQGESREAGRRVMFAAPLGIDFEIAIRARRVRVLEVWRIKLSST